MNTQQSTHWFDPLFTTERMRAIFSDHGRLQGLLDFEAALARAEARVGVIPATAAPLIEAQCRAERFDLAALAQATALAGNSAIPLVKALTARVAEQDAAASRYVHWGATSQDAMDTGLVLQLRAALEVFETELAGLSAAAARLAAAHRRTPLAGRTWLQHAPPVTFGLKAAGWFDALERHRARLRELRPRLLVIQLGGAAGTLAALGESGLEVAAALADELELGLPELPWHGSRDRLAEVATTLGLLVGSLGKIARDLSLLMQTEVGEAFEPAAAGRGGSSTMPHKRNPVGCAVALAAATRVPGLVATMLAAMVQEHERGLGGWHAEWDTLPEICTLTAGAAAHLRHVLEGLEVDMARMARNLELTQGLLLAEAVMIALGSHIGRLPAHHLVEQACRRAAEQSRHLRAVLAEQPEVQAHLSSEELDRLFDPAHYLGLSETLVERALAVRADEP
ncbi:MAG TPA: 3-carboxy-cis,cis-muconate cycloisomerase [Candidatus Competibacteraceae bacterium]|nr:3-carboxy-cis,cis-muconate cycloisomerase [Candidatus Competibacteraceae bacterium]